MAIKKRPKLKMPLCPEDKLLRSRMGRRSRTKGHSFERLIARLLKSVFPECRRHLEYQDIEANGIDLVKTGPYLIQCKRGKKYASLIAIEEIQVCPIEGGIPVLVTQGDFKEPLAALPLTDFIELLKRAKRGGAQLE